MELIESGKDFLIAPSILSADFAKLGAEVDASLAAGADVVHFDVMDNHYVPNLTIGPMVCSALRKHGVTAPIDVHLMVSPVDRIVQDFADAGASYITFHPEASPHVCCGVLLRTRRWRHAVKRAGRPHAPAHQLDGLQVRPRLQPRDAPRHPQVRHGQGRHHSAHVREPGLRRPGLVARCVEINCNALHAIDAMDSMAWDSLVYFLTAVEQGRRRAAAVPRQGREAAPDALANHGPAARPGHGRGSARRRPFRRSRTALHRRSTPAQASPRAAARSSRATPASRGKRTRRCARAASTW